ncbi:MAG: hypothetical protein SPLM_05210, partial [Spiroplasma phoeniceum]
FELLNLVLILVNFVEEPMWLIHKMLKIY